MPSKKIEILDVVCPFLVDEIVNKDNYKKYLNSKIVSSKIEFEDVTNKTIPIDLSGIKHIRHITVAPGTNVPTHAHNSPVVRFIILGDATVNGVTYQAGDWMIIPAKCSYSISTTGGYQALGFCHMWSSVGTG
ncbi:hypothetical protein [Paraburkholderia caffeinilytica]|uniref:Cupin 2 conserved barrel domain-containing protein n=1 Tax=Paraburkholderia caffeinilytica TaxID=1761016 RepID=A0ABQ1N879_9BURK|nr:hypothetical protein [Paraburkholderia caffeinilytica]GGC57907.1 hypothetical protein GCM10011400_51970 [Paraburkholderia caffeinilytica]CAB3804904.1 hypothetical protein LMG28690_06138 [Paraburkholderia caffeinilytica]